MNPSLKRWLDRLASVEFTLFAMGLAMIVIFFGTIAQAKMGTFAAQQEFFNRFFVTADFGGFKLPIFPGGLTVGVLWMINLMAAYAVRFTFRRRDLGLHLSHTGLVLLLLGQFLTQMLSRETQMPVEIGQTLNYSISFRDTEIAITRVDDPLYDELTSIPESVYSKKRVIAIPQIGMTLKIRKFIPNAHLGSGAGAGTPNLATQGVGAQIAVQEIPRTLADDESNLVTAYVEVLEGSNSRGTWLLSTGLGAPQGFRSADGKEWRLAIRPRRHYYPFSLTLKEFKHDRYAGTDIPKNFSSLVQIRHAEKNEKRDALIYMNNPLRYEGNTFYQASFGKGDTLSVFQVVRNPAWLTPYISCTMITVGLLIQFLMSLSLFIRKRYGQ